MIGKSISKAIFCGRESILINKENNTQKKILPLVKKKTSHRKVIK